MSYLPERINTAISTQELERRWTAIRAAMAEQHIDVLLMQNTNDHMGGYVKYFTDLPAMFGYPVTVTFPRDDRMCFIAQGAIGVAVQPRLNPPNGMAPPCGDLHCGIARTQPKPVGASRKADKIALSPTAVLMAASVYPTLLYS